MSISLSTLKQQNTAAELQEYLETQAIVLQEWNWIIPETVARNIVSLLSADLSIQPEVISQFQELPTVDKLFSCLRAWDVLQVVQRDIVFTSVSDASWPHPLLFDPQEAWRGDLVLSDQPISPSLLQVWGFMIEREQDRHENSLKLSPEQIAKIHLAIAAFLQQGTVLDDEMVKTLRTCFGLYTKQVENLFHKDEILKLKKVIEKDRQTKKLKAEEKGLLFSVLQKIENWFARSASFYAQCVEINWSDAHLLLSLYKSEAVDKTTFTGLLPLLKWCRSWNAWAEDELYKYITYHQPELVVFCKKFLWNMSWFDEKVKDFFKSFAWLVSSEMNVYLNFLTWTYPHAVPADLQALKNMLATTSRINLPSWNMALTWTATTPVHPSPLGEWDLEVKERQELFKYRWLLQAYVETSDRLTKDTLTETGLFKKIVWLDSKKITVTEMTYLKKNMEKIYKKELVLRGTDASTDRQMVKYIWLANFIENETGIDNVSDEILKKDFVLYCMQKDHLLDIVLSGYNLTKSAPTNTQVIAVHEQRNHAIIEAVRASERFMKVLFDLIRMYEPWLKIWQNNMYIDRESAEVNVVLKRDIRKRIDRECAAYQQQLNQMHMHSLKFDDADTRSDNTDIWNMQTTWKQLFHAHTTIFAELDEVQNMCLALQTEWKATDEIVRALQLKYGNTGIHSALVVLMTMMDVFQWWRRKKSMEYFINIFGSDNIIVFLSLLYQDVNRNLEDGNKERVIAIVETRMQQVTDYVSVFEQLEYLDACMWTSLAPEVYKLLVVVCIEQWTYAPMELDDEFHDSTFVTTFVSENDITPSYASYDLIHMATDWDETDYDTELPLLAKWRERTISNPDYVFHDVILPAANQHPLLEYIFKRLYANGECGWLFETLIAHQEDDCRPDYPDNVINLRQSINQLLVATWLVSPKGVTQQYAKDIMYGMQSQGTWLPWLDAWVAVEHVDEGDIDDLEALLRGEVPDNVAGDMRDEYWTEWGEEDDPWENDRPTDIWSEEDD